MLAFLRIPRQRARRLLIPAFILAALILLTRHAYSTSSQQPPHDLDSLYDDDITYDEPSVPVQTPAPQGPAPQRPVPERPPPVIFHDQEDDDDIEDDYYGNDRPSRPRKRPGVAVPPLGKQRPPSSPSAYYPKHTFRTDGLLEVNPEGRHPIYDLIERAQRIWRDKVERQSKTLEEAVLEYKRRYSRLPPPGFDKWWYWARVNHVQLPDEYDKIYHDIEPLWGVDPKELRDTQKAWEDHSDVYTIGKDRDNEPAKLLNFNAGDEYKDIALWRAQLQLKVIKDVGVVIPKFRASFTAHDGPYQFWSHMMKDAAVEAASTGEYINYGTLPFQPYLGWASACPAWAPLHDDIWEVHPKVEDFHTKRPKTFIHDHVQSSDPCQHPELAHIVGFLSNHQKGPGPNLKIIPAFSMCATPLHSDILAVAPEQWTEDIGEDVPWGEKTDSRLFWRGSNTGAGFEPGLPWNISQRIRLISQGMDKTGIYDVLEPNPPELPVGGPSPNKARELNERLMDVAFTGEPIQCIGDICDTLAQTFEFRKDYVDQSRANQYKYMLDIDGNGWSARFKRLMTTNSCVLKSTGFPEWYADRVQPWVHYVPIQIDLSDLYDVLTFFRGDSQGNGDHDHLAASIAEAGKTWSETFYREIDMTAYMFRLYLEYARVMSLDRDELVFEL